MSASGNAGSTECRAHLAGTRAEREGVYRLRYDVYVRELRKSVPGVIDHVRRWIKDADDECSGVHIFYTGTVDDMSGSLRMQVWEPGAVPAEVTERFSLHLFPGIGRQRIAEAGRLIVRPDRRGGQILSVLACAAFDYETRDREPFVCFLSCVPGLVRTYMRLGFRACPGAVITAPDGVRLPMFMLASDLAHLEAVGSPLAPLMARRFGSGTIMPDLLGSVGCLRSVQPHYETDPARIREEVCERLDIGPATRSRVFEGVSPEEVEALCRCALVMEIPAETIVMREGLVERELYVVLSGRFEVVLAGRRLGELGAGDVLGEISFFQTPGERVATVRAVTEGRVLVLERHFLDSLLTSHPGLVSRLLFNLGRIVSGHLAVALRADTARRAHRR